MLPDLRSARSGLYTTSDGVLMGVSELKRDTAFLRGTLFLDT